MNLKPNDLNQYQGQKSQLYTVTLSNHTSDACSTVGLAVTSDRISLDVSEFTKFSVWVSFCEIYNENIHDLLEALPNSSHKRTALRLSQDVKDTASSKVRAERRNVRTKSALGARDTADEAYRVLKLGKKNQSFSSTKLNQLSSRSHSIFSIRILRLKMSERQEFPSSASQLCVCDLAGSERCAKTHNKGERLKEAGNINSSLLILGKCINALRHNQQAKLLQHVPFRECKLTHYLQSFLCGRGRACMIVNINQCASMYDETLNVLKFSAVAQKVVVLNSKSPDLLPERWSTDASFLLDCAEEGPKRKRRSSENVWDTSLEDVQEDEADEYESSRMEDTTHCSSLDESTHHQEKILICKKTYQSQMALLGQLQVQLKQELAQSLEMEARIREEISKEFSQIFSDMQKDYDERLARERDILEERAEKRLEIFKNLSQKMSREEPYQDSHAMDPFSAELAEMENYPEAYLTGPMSERSHGFEQLYSGEGGAHSGDRAGLMRQLQEKSFQVSSLEKQVAQLQKTLEQKSSGAQEQRTADQLQKALADLEKEKRARQEALAALEAQTVERVEALACLESERKAREQTQSTLTDLQSKHKDMSRALEEEKKGRSSLRSALEEERRVKEETKGALEKERKGKEELKSALEKERKAKEDLRSSLAEEQKRRQDQKSSEEQLTSLREKNKARQQECEELKAKLQATESKVSSESKRAEQVSAQLQTAQNQLDKLSSEVQDKTRRIQTLTQEVDNVKQERQTSVASSEMSTNLLKDEISELRAALASEKEQHKRKNNQITQKEQELASAKEQLPELNEKLRRQSGCKEEVETLRKKLAERDESLQRPLQELRAKLESQEKEKKTLSAKLEEEKKNLEKTKEKLLEQDANSKRQCEALQKQLSEQQAASDQLLCDAKLQLYEQQEVADKLRAQLELANGKCAALQDHNKQTDDQARRIREMERSLEEKDRAHKEKLAELAKKGESVQKRLEEREKEEAENQAVQETRRREVEKRRELLGKAEEAIAQKDAELEKKSADVNRLKQSLQQESDKVKSLNVDLQRRDEHSNELQEKLADYKKQLQQVQKEISSMREEERGLKQRLSDLEKSKKQLQTDLANRDRTIHQLRTMCVDKHRAERKAWMEEKLSLIAQAKDAEERRNQDMKRFAEDRDKYQRQHSQLEALSVQLREKDQTMEQWRKDRDTLVSALEVQLQKLLSSQTQKDKLIQELQQSSTSQTPAEDQDKQQGPESERLVRKSRGRRETRTSVISQSSAGCQSVLDSSEISTENGRTSRFPRPELEISFSPLQPNRMALKRQGEESTVTVKITRSARKRKSSEMDKQDEVEAENRRNTRTKVTPKKTPQKEEKPSSYSRHESQSSVRSSRKDGTLQKIGDFLQSSPTLLGSKAKKMMGLVSGRDVSPSGSAPSSLRAKKNKKTLYRPEISSPMDVPPHPIINRDAEEKESDHQIIKRCLRSRVVK
ncbi:hypothetical protein WMY93_000734 [Mugilogobius chulae]|uniref:Kinesin motor domain-containing protein n=1 Tax=Mugilogobius chulae TaxID=88201 RepID=A0AAW0Q047_9GOBI